ncbi:MAG: hypothetical protein R3Y64_06650 [Peptostreptococcaceae bacterium]
MNNKFINWYSQAIGSVLGMVVCLYSYLCGNLYTFGNISDNLENIGISSAMSSFLLFPFCILCLLLSFMKNGKKFSKSDLLESFNSFVIIFTTIIGFVGINIFFIPPSLFFLISIYLTYHKVEVEEIEELEVEITN